MVTSNWYEVSYNGKKGFVLGALLSLHSFTRNKNTFLFQLSNKNDQLWLKVRVLNGTDFKEYSFNLIGKEFSLGLTNGRGLKNIENIIAVNYISEACGVEGGVSYLLWNGNILSKLADLSRIVDADQYSFDEKFIFPDDANGISNKIKYELEIEHLEDESTNWRISEKQEREYTWDGEKLLPNFEHNKKEE